MIYLTVLPILGIIGMIIGTGIALFLDNKKDSKFFENSVQVVIGEDHQYHCIINNKTYGIGLTFPEALKSGRRNFEKG